MSRARQPRHRLRGRRERAARGDGAEPARRLAPLGERDGVLLPRVPLRVLLSPLAEHAGLWRPQARRSARSALGTLVITACVVAVRGSLPARACAALHGRRRGQPGAGSRAALALAARARRGRAAGRRVGDDRLRADRRRLRERLPRLDRVLYVLFVFGSMYWLETTARDVVPLPRRRGAAGPAPGDASGDADRTGDDIARPAVARPAGARGARRSTGLPRRDRRAHLVHPLPALEAMCFLLRPANWPSAGRSSRSSRRRSCTRSAAGDAVTASALRAGARRSTPGSRRSRSRVDSPVDAYAAPVLGAHDPARAADDGRAAASAARTPVAALVAPLPLASAGRSRARVLAGSTLGPLRGALWRRRPLPAFVAVQRDLLLWHLPALYDLTLRNALVHDLEHALFFSTGAALLGAPRPAACRAAAALRRRSASPTGPRRCS